MKIKVFLFILLFSTAHIALLGQGDDSISARQSFINSNILYTKDSVRKVDLIDYFAKFVKLEKADDKRSNHKVYFSLFPSSSNISGNKTSFTSFSAAFLLGDITNTKVSNIYFYPYIGSGGRYGFQLQPSIWLNRNSWNLTGEYFILNYPQNTWGLGGNTPPEHETEVEYKHVRIHQNILTGILPNLSIGLGYAFDEHYDVKVVLPDTTNMVLNYLPEEMHKTISSGIALPVLFDSRRNALNPQQGGMLSFTWRFYDQFFGSDDRWQSLFIDVRKYLRISDTRNQLVAFRSYYWTVLSGNVPYFDLPANRWEPASGSASRGIKQNRYRSNALLYFETEYRFGITANEFLGGVVFVNLVGPSQYNTQQYMYWHPAAGAGLRMKFNKYSNTNITLDAGFSKDFWSVYMAIGEAF